MKRQAVRNTGTTALVPGAGHGYACSAGDCRRAAFDVSDFVPGTPDVPRSVEDFRPRERQKNVSAAAGDDDLFVNGVQGYSRGRDSRDLPDGNLPARRSVTTVVNTPGADAAGDDPAFRRICLDLADTAECGVRSLNDEEGAGLGFTCYVPSASPIGRNLKKSSAKSSGLNIGPDFS